MMEHASNTGAHSQPLPHKDPSEAAKLLPPIGSPLRSLCGEYDEYTYSPLNHSKNETRIIKILHRTSIDAPIHCTVENAKYPLGLNFKALSYTWGPPSCNDILVDGKRFVVRDNLYNFLFLESLRSTCQDTGYWIDQFCIDQSNTEERNYQVARMSDIYSFSWDGVLVWLGAGTEESDWAMEKMKQPPSIQATDVEVLRTVETMDGLRAIGHALYALAVIARSEYWKRLWIIQEVILGDSPTIQYGSKEISLQQLISFVDACYKLTLNVCRLEAFNTVYSFIVRIDYTVKLGELVVAGPQIRALLHSRDENHRENYFSESDEETVITWRQLFHTLDSILPVSQCQDPRDRIFGMLGLVHRDLRIDVNYDCTAEEVAEQVLEKELLQFRREALGADMLPWHRASFVHFSTALDMMLEIRRFWVGVEGAQYY